MASIVTLNGIPYSIPSTGEVGWGSELSNYLIALGGGGVLQLEGGAFTLLNELNVGPNVGIASPYFRSGVDPAAAAGVIRLTNSEAIAWRNSGNTADLALTVVGNTLYFDGNPIGGAGGGSPLTTKGDLYSFSTVNARLPVGLNGQALVSDSGETTGLKWTNLGGAGGGSVIGFTFTNANGISGSVATSTTTPTLTLSLGAITPTSVSTIGNVAATGTVLGSNLSGTHSGTSSGTNTGDQTITLTGDVTGSGTGSFATTLATVSIAKGGTGQVTANASLNALLPTQAAQNGKVLLTDGTNTSWQAFTGGGSVTAVSSSGTQGVITSVTNPTTTPVVNIGLGAITPTSVAASGLVTGSNISGTATGTNTGDQTIQLTGDVTGSGTGSFGATLSNTGVTAGTYSSANITVDAKGRISAASNGSGGSLTGFTNGATNYSTALGQGALTTAPTSIRNTAIGYNALNLNTASSENVAIGYMAASSLSNVNSTGNVAIGNNAMDTTTHASGCTAVGISALGSMAGVYASSGDSNTAIGAQSLQLLTTGRSSTAVGYLTLGLNSTGLYNTALGTQAGYSYTGSYNTAVGGLVGAGIFPLAGDNNTNVGYGAGASAVYSNYSCLGSASTVTGSNQVQLGNSSTTTYAYGAVQNRSDVRDKTDITDTELGLDFISKLRPVDFRWDMREDYKTEMPDTKDKVAFAQWIEDCKLSNITHDGSKKRNRKHHGLIAQEVKAVMTELNVDFAGFQDHKLAGGDDVLSIGYEELIAPMIRAIQELKAEIEILKNK